MLGSLARKLRLYGFDVLYDTNGDDKELLGSARRLKRLLLTSDEALFRQALKNRVPALVIKGDTDIERLTEVFEGIKESPPPIRPGSSRCPACNGQLRFRRKEESVHGLPKRLLESRERLYVCRNCGKIYWEGSHWKRIRQIERSVAVAVQQS